MNAQIIGETQIQHRADAQGVRITKLQFVRVAGVVSVAEFWHDWQSGKLVQVTSRKPNAQETFALIGR